MPVKPTQPRIGPILNPIRPPAPKVELPTLARAKAAFGAYEFHSPNHQIKWSTKKPAGEVLKELVIQKPPPKGRTGDSIRACVLKSDPTKLYFVKGGSTMPHYFGPVSWKAIPKDGPRIIMNPIRPATT